MSLHFAGFVHNRGGKEKYTPFFTSTLSFMGSMTFMGFFIFRASGLHESHIGLMSFMDELNAALLYNYDFNLCCDLGETVNIYNI